MARNECFRELLPIVIIRGGCVNLNDTTLFSSVLQGAASSAIHVALELEAIGKRATPEKVDGEDNSRQIALIHPSLPSSTKETRSH